MEYVNVILPPVLTAAAAYIAGVFSRQGLDRNVAFKIDTETKVDIVKKEKELKKDATGAASIVEYFYGRPAVGQPPSVVFPIVWSTIYTTFAWAWASFLAVSFSEFKFPFWQTWFGLPETADTFVVLQWALFAVNMVLNPLWCYFYFSTWYGVTKEVVVDNWPKYDVVENKKDEGEEIVIQRNGESTEAVQVTFVNSKLKWRSALATIVALLVQTFSITYILVDNNVPLLLPSFLDFGFEVPAYIGLVIYSVWLCITTTLNATSSPDNLYYQTGLKVDGGNSTVVVIGGKGDVDFGVVVYQDGSSVTIRDNDAKKTN